MLTRIVSFVNKVIGAEISTASLYFDEVVDVVLNKDYENDLFNYVSCQNRKKIFSLEEIGEVSARQKTMLVFNGTFNYSSDIQSTLDFVHQKVGRSCRVAAVCYNSYLRWLYLFLSFLNVRIKIQPTTFLTYADIDNLVKLSGFEIVKARQCVYCPFKLLGLGILINKIFNLIPVVRNMSLATVFFLRPVKTDQSAKPSLSIIVPARNEAGNIPRIIPGIVGLDGVDIEYVFVEGHSNDKTWDEIQKIVASNPKVKAYRQEGEGKYDAVKLGFEKSTGDLLVIFDADMTVPPEHLERFYKAWVEGKADFINGSRLLYSMETGAMQFLNILGNHFFAKTIKRIIQLPIADTLCGTKLISRDDYSRLVTWRNHFGDFDPFGDFELLYFASVGVLGVVDVPIRYRARTYGSTQIRRFYHGIQLFKMLMIGFFKIKLGKS